LMSFSQTDVNTSRGETVPSVCTRMKSSGTLGCATAHVSGGNGKWLVWGELTFVASHHYIRVSLKVLREEIT
jgi:hypothetical protein